MDLLRELDMWFSLNAVFFLCVRSHFEKITLHIILIFLILVYDDDIYNNKKQLNSNVGKKKIP